MVASTYPFNRWIPREDRTWAFQVFQKHNAELTNMLMSHLAASKFTYTTLGKNLGAKFSDSYDKWLPEIKEMQYTGFYTLQDWSGSYNLFANWINLNCVMAMSANLETYMATVINLALESDVGILYNASRKIDGIEILKYSRAQPFEFANHVTGCTKGDWNSRISYFEKIFGNCPLILKNNIKDLESLRKLRNNIGHAFGREIETSRQHQSVNAEKMAALKVEKTIDYLRLVFKVAKEIDNQLYQNNIGSYQDLHFYHNLRPTLFNESTLNNDKLTSISKQFKHLLNQHAAKTAGIVFCKGLIEYYEAL